MRIAVAFYALRLYPRSYRQQFAEEMRLVFQMSLEEAKTRWGAIHLCLRELRDFPSALLGAYKLENRMAIRHRVLAAAFVVTVAAAALISLRVWGYLFAPPPVAPLTELFQQVTAMSAFRVAPDYTFTPASVAAVPVIPDRFIPTDRIFEALADRLPPLNPAYQNVTLLKELRDKFLEEAVELGAYYVDSSNPTPSPEYFPTGYILEGIDHEGNTLVLVNFSSTQINNDDYTYYEWLFRKDDEGLTEIGRNHFNYHVAGLEGFTFPMIVTVCMFPMLIIYLLHGFITELHQHLRKQRQLRMG
jgi:hypothetical protein